MLVRNLKYCADEVNYCSFDNTALICLSIWLNYTSSIKKLEATMNTMSMMCHDIFDTFQNQTELYYYMG